MRRFVVIALVLVVIGAAGAALAMRPTDPGLDSAPFEQDGRLLFREHHPLAPAPIYTAGENAVMNGQSDFVTTLLDALLAEGTG